MRCSLCPLSLGVVCRGETHRVFCGYIDPASRVHRPEYTRILATDEVHLSDQDRAMMIAKAEFDGEFAAVSGCGC